MSHESERGSGILMPIYSLPSQNGIGNLGTSAINFVDLLVDLKQKYWQLLPIGPTSFGDSPYQTISAFAGNPYYIDLELLVQEGLLTQEEVDSVDWGNDDSLVDYGKLYENRFKILRLAYRRVKLSDIAYDKYLEGNAYWLEDYALFMTIKGMQDEKPWSQWEEAYRDREPKAMEAVRHEQEDEMNFWKYLQYEFAYQWKALKNYANGKGVQMIGDVPMFLSEDSSDVWAHRESFLMDGDGRPEYVAAAMPDLFSNEGQIWGNPVYDWKVMEKQGFEWWRNRYRMKAQLFDLLRIDNFQTIDKGWVVANGETDITQGKWLRGPGRKLTAAIKEEVGDCKIFAESTGYLSLGAAKLMNRMNWATTRILMFAFEGNTADMNLPHNYKNDNIVTYVGTHDNDTVVGYFRDCTEFELAYLYEYLGINHKEEIPDALIKVAYSSVASIAIVQMQDILKLGHEYRTNAPSTVENNWRWRIGKMSMSEDRRAWIRTLVTLYNR